MRYAFKNKQNIIDQCDNFNCLNICVAEVPEDEGNFENIMVK